MTVTSIQHLTGAQRSGLASSGARLVSVEGSALPLQGTRLRAAAQGGIARVTLTQTFVNRGTEPLRVTYLLPLPENAAVSGYEFVLAGVRTAGVVKAKEDARRAFEEALVEGRSAALLEEERSTLFRQEIGNVPPGAEIAIEVTVDQKLGWRAAEGAWEWRFPTVVAPRFQGEPGRVADAERNEVAVADLAKGAHLPVRALLELELGDALSGAPNSPSHDLSVAREGERLTSISFGTDDGAALDRDIVVRWPVAAARPGLSLSVDDAGAEGTFGLLTIVPPAAGHGLAVPRDLVVLLDTSGSMGGEPLRQATAVISALVDSLTERDTLEMIEFSEKPRRWKRKPVRAKASNREKAKAWLNGLEAGGGTYMRDGILEALAPLGADAQRQVLLVTDGLIGFENEIIEEIAHRLPAACRVHTLGIGHGVNRSLTGPVARAGRGVEEIVAPGEDVSQAVRELLAATADPVLVDIEVKGAAELAARVPDVLAGSPALVPVRLERGAQPIELTVTGRTAGGTWTQTLVLPAATDAAPGSGANAQLFAREKVQDLELAGAAGAHIAEVDAAIERIGIAFQIATRRTSWVAVTDTRTVDPTEATRTVTMPHELAAGLSAEGVGLRAAFAESLAMPAPTGAPAAAGISRARMLGSQVGPARKPKAGVDASKSKKFEGGPPAHQKDGERRFERWQDDEDEAPDLFADDSAGALPAELRGEPVELRGKIVLWIDERLVLAIDVVHVFEWILPSEAVLLLADGTELTVRLSVDQSTASGLLGAGQTLRLVLVGVPAAVERAAVGLRIAAEGMVPISVRFAR